MTTQPTLTAAAFAQKWRGITTTEKAGSQYAFEKRVAKAGGGDGFADDNPAWPT